MIDRTDDFLAVEPPGRTRDVESPEAAVLALYDAISGPRGAERDWARLRSLFDPRARFLIGRWLAGPHDSQDGVYEWDLDAFVLEGREFWLKDGFWEREITSRVERYGNIAHVFSAYRSCVGSEDADPIGRGVNSVQLVRHDGRWWIVGIVWEVEAPQNPIPEELGG
jgi:hypothetical protein